MNWTKSNISFFSLSIALLIMSLWICNHFYLGVRHDGRLYTLQALYHLHPDLYSQDIFLLNNSQDNFTIFSRIHAIFIKFFGISGAHIFPVIIGQLLFIFSLYCFLKKSLDINELILAFILIATMPKNYGGLGVFTYSETFLTPRLFAESFSLFSLSFFFSEQRYKALTFCIFSILLHPIMGFICLSIIIADYLFYHRGYKKYVFFSALILLVLIFIIFGPFSDAFVEMDTEWLDVVIKRSPHLLLSNWFPGDWTSFAASCLVIAMLYIFNRQRAKHFMVICVLSIFFFLLSFIGGDLFKVVFILQIQLWRIHWILNISAYIALAILLLNLKNGNVLQYCGVLLLSLGWFDYSTAVPYVMAAGTALFIFAQIFNKHFEKITLFHSKYLTAAISLFYLEALCRPWIIEIVNKSGNFFSLLAKPNNFLTPLTFLLSSIILLVILFVFLNKLQKLTLMLSLFMLIFCINTWDQRDDWESLLFSDNPEIARIRETLPANQPFLWPGNPLGTWILFERPNYISPAQGAGVVFSRKTAIEYKRRMKSTSKLVLLLRSHFYGLLSIEDIMANFSATAGETESDIKAQLDAGLKSTCELSHDLRYVIIPDRVSELDPISKITFHDITLRNPMTNVCNKYSQVDLYLYDCKKFRN
jgi:hypothetical protein